ncbi:hypothetical protein Klosneuvirus_2_266 [Klosneuvirus KNV1]|uniref:Uncharacterized protein n=1 Tax=Klosneuvirus KNV1 TaxID=1977640 RepID=A0A1V0SJD1_9VIRU|nr:hypothetical protein Klosneuvirus_2_266 [Klosneuvirus KNV1]
MGLTTSTVTYQKPAIKYTDADIRKNIDELFNNAKTNNFSEASYSINDLDNIIISDVPQNGGIKFNSSQKRYLRHKIDGNNFQLGGNESLEEISDMSEFKRIKEYLINDMKNNQTGGDYDVDDIVSSATNASNSNQNIIKFLSALKGGNDDDLDEETLEDDEDADDEALEEAFEEDDEDDDDDEEALEDVESPKKIKKVKKERKEENFSEDKEEPAEVEISETSENGIIRNPEEYSATSFVEKSSELNILPFYSSDSSINKHPYIKNRIH